MPTLQVVKWYRIGVAESSQAIRISALSSPSNSAVGTTWANFGSAPCHPPCPPRCHRFWEGNPARATASSVFGGACGPKPVLLVQLEAFP